MTYELTPALAGHLAFTVAGRQHALPLSAVREVLHMPLLQPTEGMPAPIAGLFNLRGRVVPVQNLAARLGLPFHAPRAGDNLIVLSEDRPALWVDEIAGVVGLEGDASGVASVGTQLYHLLDLEHLEEAQAEPLPADLLAGMDPAERPLLEARAEAYLETPLPESETLRPVLGFELNGEVFAVDLPEVREIAPCPPIHPLPGAPAAYLGLASHRGEPLLVLDLRPLVGLAQTAPQPDARLLVVDEDGGRVGLYTDAVRDVLSLDARDLHPPILEHGPWEWIEGEWVVGERPVSLLRLRPLLSQTGNSPI